ncbi:50S ribosomal protein L11 methyltransferase [Fructilactobacillus carniphilus]|uniref:Ribosomal protein L11 methyltransferase n=1 Tax=Fructilactobacillus carniphilus TaxID=2940297 RepID=A0ABY5C140_9LACO|nr:50S ribosomal protein L11 methyltransferase [Fructilactobacillus carniphilus]USS91021.1 50S ribosomal protein L11 methyltransferase [Fructilactobacillus carniphilus]
MKLTEVRITTTNEAAEAVSNLLITAGAQGIQLDDQLPGDQVAVITYITEDLNPAAFIKQVEQGLSHFTEYGLNAGVATIETRPVDEQWTTEWEQYYHAERITRYLTVVPNWEDYQPAQTDQKVIRLDPGMAFGTGTHPTTKMSLQALETILRGGETLFDVGTGSGVLSIGARLLGAKAIRAWDNDSVAVESAQKNLAMNPGMEDIQVSQNSLLTGIDGTADVIVANMLAEVLLPLIPQVPAHLRDHGQLILAGIYVDQLPKIQAQLDEQQLTVEQIMAVDNWRAVIATKKGQ